MRKIRFVGGVTEYRVSSLDRVQRVAGDTAGAVDRPAITGTGGRT